MEVQVADTGRDLALFNVGPEAVIAPRPPLAVGQDRGGTLGMRARTSRNPS